MAAEQPEPNEVPSAPEEPMNRKQRRANAVLKRRQTHKEVVEEIQEPDQFQQQGRPVMDWVLDHVRELAMGMGAIIAILFVWGVINSMSASKAEEAAEALFKARRDLPALSAPTSEDGGDAESLGKALTALEGFIAEYGSTPQGDEARVDAAGVAYRMGDYDKALALYGEVAGTGTLVGQRAMVGQAYAQEAKGSLAEAAATLESLKGALSGDAQAQVVLDLARVYAANGQGDKAKGLLSTFEDEYPDSLLLPDAQARLAALQ